MTDIEETRPTFGQRFGVWLDRAEGVYLRLLRAMVLIIATLLIVYTLWLGVSSLYKIMQSPDSVEEAVAAVAADELTDAEMPVRDEAGAEARRPDAARKRYYDDFTRRYYALFRSKFEPFRQAEDKRLTRDEFDDTFVNAARRVEAAAQGDLDFGSDRADLEKLLAVMTEAAAKPATQQRLQRYRAAKKVQVTRQVERTRTEYRAGWDASSTSCYAWYEYPYGCSVRRAVQVPYTATVKVMEFPSGTQSHTQIFRAFQDRYFTLLEARRGKNARDAAAARDEIMLGNVTGKLTLFTALQVFGGFLVLMFFFLLIAIERHQRRISDRLEV